MMHPLSTTTAQRRSKHGMHDIHVLCYMAQCNWHKTGKADARSQGLYKSRNVVKNLKMKWEDFHESLSQEKVLSQHILKHFLWEWQAAFKGSTREGACDTFLLLLILFYYYHMCVWGRGMCRIIHDLGEQLKSSF